MSKRKDPQEGNDDTRMADNPAAAAAAAASDPDPVSDSEDLDTINVDFEMFDPQPAHDFHGLKHLLRQLFDSDSPLFDLSALTDLILSQPLLGTTVKTDGNESDPYAFLTVLSLRAHASHAAVEPLVAYLLAKAAAAANPALHRTLKPLLAPDAPAGHVGLILTERLLNMPVQVVPPMYKMLLEEIEWAVQDNEPYDFSHFLVLSKTYTEVASRLDEMESRPSKKWKKQKPRRPETFYYHPEDEVVRRLVGEDNAASFSFDSESGSSDSKRAFSDMGIKSQGLMMLVPKESFGKLVADLEDLFKP